MKNLFVGVLVLAAIILLAASILFLKPNVGDGKQTLHVRFSDIGSLDVGTRVLFAGRPVGEVVAMEEIDDARQQPTDALGRVYFYQLTLHIDSSIKVYNTDEISIQRSGLMGERSISITPKAPPGGVTPRLVADQPIYADSVDTFQNALLDFSDLSATMEDAFHRASHWIQTHGEDTASTFKAATAAFQGLAQMAATVNEIDLISDLGQSICSFRSVLLAVAGAIDEMKKGHAFRNTAETVARLKGASQSIETACGAMASGKGTIGRLITDDHTYLQLNALLTKADHLMNDINHYGLLFHLNKKWQRLRLKKISRLNALSTPESFQTYFAGEIDEINAAMARISLLIERADQTPHRGAILSNPAFKRDFANLLRKADQLSDNLKLYHLQFKHFAGQTDG